jgi:hypothetical protein
MLPLPSAIAPPVTPDMATAVPVLLVELVESKLMPPPPTDDAAEMIERPPLPLVVMLLPVPVTL